MFSKILSFFLVYILSLVNFFMVLSPFVFLLLGKYFLKMSLQTTYIESLALLLLALASLLMLLFLFFDFVFSSSILYYTARSMPVAKSGVHSRFAEVFDGIRRRFAVGNVELYIMESEEINAFAIGSLRRNVVVLTTGLLSLYRFSIDDTEKFIASVEGILAHEMSHILNRDYFVALLLRVNERATNLASGLVAALFEVISRIFSIVPVIGQYIALAVDMLYSAINFVLNFFYRYIMLNLYRFLQLQLSKSIEYRADEQAALVVGGESMAETLGFLGTGGYFSIFSSHPLTSSRVRNVSKIRKTEGLLQPVAGTNLTFALSFSIILVTFYCSYRLARVQVLLEAYRGMVLFFRGKYIMLRGKITILLSRFFAR